MCGYLRIVRYDSKIVAKFSKISKINIPQWSYAIKILCYKYYMIYYHLHINQTLCRYRSANCIHEMHEKITCMHLNFLKIWRILDELLKSSKYIKVCPSFESYQFRASHHTPDKVKVIRIC